MPASRTALIVGAGIGGLAAGLALRRAGWEIRIFERAATPRELGFALALAPNAMAALDALGVAGAIASNGVAPVRVEVRHADGRRIRRFEWATTSVPATAQTHVALRPVVHGALLDAVGSASIELDSEAAGVESGADGVVLTLRNGRTIPGDVLIGADGAGSAIRKDLHPDEPPPRASGYWAIRGVAQDVGHHLGDLSAVAFFGPGIESSAARASERAVYWYISLLTADVGDGRDAAALLRRRLAGVDPALRAIVEATPSADLRSEALLRRDPLASWGRGRVTLLGDAAHPVLPHTGQGAAQALEDAVALGLVLTSGAEVEAALRRYEQVRFRRTRQIQRLGPRIARVTTTHSRVVAALRTAIVRLVPMAMLNLAAKLNARDPHRALRAS